MGNVLVGRIRKGRAARDEQQLALGEIPTTEKRPAPVLRQRGG
jgi:hypothetical protein